MGKTQKEKLDKLFQEFEEQQDQLEYIDSIMSVSIENNSKYIIDHRANLIEDIRETAEILIDAGYAVKIRNTDFF